MDRKRRQIRYNNDLGAGVPNWWVMAPMGPRPTWVTEWSWSRTSWEPLYGSRYIKTYVSVALAIKWRKPTSRLPEMLETVHRGVFLYLALNGHVGRTNELWTLTTGEKFSAMPIFECQKHRYHPWRHERDRTDDQPPTCSHSTKKSCYWISHSPSLLSVRFPLTIRWAIHEDTAFVYVSGSQWWKIS